MLPIKVTCTVLSVIPFLEMQIIMLRTQNVGPRSNFFIFRNAETSQNIANQNAIADKRPHSWTICTNEFFKILLDHQPTPLGTHNLEQVPRPSSKLWNKEGKNTNTVKQILVPRNKHLNIFKADNYSPVVRLGEHKNVIRKPGSNLRAYLTEIIVMNGS